MTEAKCIVPTRDLVGESPFWDAASGCLYWVDIVGRTIRRLRLADGEVTSRQTGDFPTAIALAEGGGAVVSFAAGLFRYDFDTGATEPIAAPEPDPLMRLNEGRCDPSGRFWAASMETNLNPDGSAREMGAWRGALYRVDADGGVTRFGEPDLGIPNTMAWSPDRETFYFGDTLRNTIWAFDYDDETGTVANRRVLIEGGPGLPDGSCIDAEGFLWNARFGAGRVLRIAPDGRIRRELVLACTNPTSCTFGGEGLRTLFVTSGRFGLGEDVVAANPEEGGLFALEPGVAGVPEHYYRPAG